MKLYGVRGYPFPYGPPLELQSKFIPSFLRFYSSQDLGEISALTFVKERTAEICVWQGVAMDSLKFELGPPCFTLLRPAGVPTLKQPYGRFRDGQLAGRSACGCFLPLWTPHAVRLRKERTAGTGICGRNKVGAEQSGGGGGEGIRGVSQGVAMDSLKYRYGPPCPTPLRPATILLPPWIPHAVCLWKGLEVEEMQRRKGKNQRKTKRMCTPGGRRST
jgi:hypothetical protein